MHVITFVLSILIVDSCTAFVSQYKLILSS